MHSAPHSAASPPPSHSARNHTGLWIYRATTGGAMKMPMPSIDPVTIDWAAQRPSRPLGSRGAGSMDPQA